MPTVVVLYATGNRVTEKGVHQHSWHIGSQPPRKTNNNENLNGRVDKPSHLDIAIGNALISERNP